MSWIKRNLYFVVGSLVALGLMGYGGFYLYSQITNEQKVTSEIKELFDTYTELLKLPNSGKTDNAKRAREQEALARDAANKLRGHFASPPAIPASARVDKQLFTKELPAAIASLVSEAQQSSVSLPKDFWFTFQSQKSQVIFEPGSLEKLAVHLGEIKALCHILFLAKINALDGLKRETVSTDDRNSSDYLDQKTTETALGVITPYEISFRCFTADLTEVMAGFANSPYCFVVKTVNIEPAPGVAAEIVPLAVAPTGVQPVGPAGRYGNLLPPGSGPPPGYFQTPGMSVPQPAPGAAPAARGGLTTVLNEQPLRVTMAIQLIKRKPAK